MTYFVILASDLTKSNLEKNSGRKRDSKMFYNAK